MKTEPAGQPADPAAFPGLVFHVGQKIAGEEIRKQSQACYGRLADARGLFLNAMAGPLHRAQQGELLFQHDERYELRMSLCAVFMQGLRVTEFAIEEGRYLQAQALVRQEMETLARIKEAASKDVASLEGKTPNVNVLDETMRRMYSDLSGAAHASQARHLRSVTVMEPADFPMPEDTEGTRFYPMFDEVLCRKIFTLHLLLMALVTAEMLSDMQTKAVNAALVVTDQDRLWFESALSLMLEEEVITIDKPIGH